MSRQVQLQIQEGGMALRTGHGTGAGVPRVEVLTADELRGGVQETPQASAGHERRPDGTFARGARTVEAAGGGATPAKSRLTPPLGLSPLAEAHPFRPSRAAAATFRRV